MYLEHKMCYVCEAITAHYNGKCGKCLERDANEKERMWEAQNISTKVTDLRKRLEKLEQRVYEGPAKY